MATAGEPNISTLLSTVSGVGINIQHQQLVECKTTVLEVLNWRLLVEIVETKAYPREWNDWIAMLAMKPGEDPKELERSARAQQENRALSGVVSCWVGLVELGCPSWLVVFLGWVVPSE